MCFEFVRESAGAKHGSKGEVWGISGRARDVTGVVVVVVVVPAAEKAWLLLWYDPRVWDRWDGATARGGGRERGWSSGCGVGRPRRRSGRMGAVHWSFHCVPWLEGAVVLLASWGRSSMLSSKKCATEYRF